MPPKRKSVSRRASNQQSTLTFNGKANRITKPAQQQQQQRRLNVKPGVDGIGKGKRVKKDPALDDEGEMEEVEVVEEVVRADLQDPEPQASSPTTADIAIESQASKALVDPEPAPNSDAVRIEDVLGGRAEVSEVGATGGAVGVGWVGDEEARARRVSDAQVKRYWRKKEEARIVPRVHQEGLSLEEKVLREWDMSGQYGVSPLLSLHSWWESLEFGSEC